MVLVSGPTHLKPPVGVKLESVATARDMHEAVMRLTPEADALVMAAAVADYAPAETATQKMKKSEVGRVLSLQRTADILSSIAERRARTGFPSAVIGFAAESESLVENARHKLEAKGLDLIVANDITSTDAGFSADTNRVILIGRDGAAESLPLLSKAAVSEAVLDRAERILAG